MEKLISGKTGTRSHSVIFMLLFVLMASWGCRKNVVVPEQQIPPAKKDVVAPSAITPNLPPPDPEPTETPIPKETVPPDSFMLGEQNFQKGNYRQAAQLFEKFLKASPKAQNRDQALFYLGLSLALGNGLDARPAENAFRRLIAEFPRSPYRGQAELIIGLQAQIDRLRSDVKARDDRINRLNDELRKLKSIDIQRRPSRPE